MARLGPCLAGLSRSLGLQAGVCCIATLASWLVGLRLCAAYAVERETAGPLQQSKQLRTASHTCKCLTGSVALGAVLHGQRVRLALTVRALPA